MEDVASDREELVYAPALVILADDLYPRKLEILREYIQNASDALDAFVRVADWLEDDATPLIKVSIQGKSLLVWDNGIGMDEQEVRKLKRIAYSEKRLGQEAGYKGIGRLAGTAVADKLWISSTSYGDPNLHKFEFRAGDYRKEVSTKRRKGLQDPATDVINRHTSLTSWEVDPADHYTLVELRDIDDRYADQLLNPVKLREYIGDIGPVGFAPDFTYGQRISEKLYQNVADYSPKDVWLTTATGDRSQIYKPYTDGMKLAEPEFIEIYDQKRQTLLGYCWCATKGKEMLGKLRPAGGRFAVDGGTPEEKRRLAGLAYKLFGFSVGDRTLAINTLWPAKDITRALWFTGEIHLVDKEINPTTDRSNFVDNEARNTFYEIARPRIAKHLNSLAQDVSNNRKAYDTAERYRTRFAEVREQLKDGRVERADLNTIKKELYQAEDDLKRTCKDRDIKQAIKREAQAARELLKQLEAARTRKDRATEIKDLARDVDMTTHARKVYTIIMDAVENYFSDDKDTYYDLSAEIRKAVKKRY